MNIERERERETTWNKTKNIKHVESQHGQTKHIWNQLKTNQSISLSIYI